MTSLGEMALRIVVEVWHVTTRMSPYLLLGFVMAGILSVVVSPRLIEEHLGRRGWAQILKAALLGVPIPLCSCGVIPVATSMRRHGASRGATLSFLASTPQTGVDSILVTHGLLGGTFTLVRVGVALLSGLVCGTIDELIDKGEDTTTSAPACSAACCSKGKRHSAWRRMLEHGFIELPKDISGAVLFGIVLSGLLSALVPANFFADRLPPGLLSMLLMMVIGIPLYSCSTGSVPLALSLIHMGVSPGAAFVFLVTGPATNAATVTTLIKILGRKSAAAYLLGIAVCALAGGWLIEMIVDPTALQEMAMGTMKHGPSWIGTGSAIILIAMLGYAFVTQLVARVRKPREHTHTA